MLRLRFWWILLIVCMLPFFFYRSEKRVLLIGPAQHEQDIYRHLPYTCYCYHLPDFLNTHVDLSHIIEQICALAREKGIDGMLSSDDYAGPALVSICSQKLGLIAPTPLSILTCQHKYYSRLAQNASVPEATPAFSLGPNLPFPCFVKPVKSFFSIYAQKALSSEEIKMPKPAFFDFFDQLIAYATPFGHDEERILAEELLHGQQVTWEGYVYHGKMQTIGIVDSIMHPGTISFQRFEYPSKLPDEVQRRIEDIAKRVISYIGLDNTLCNLEIMYDKEQDRISIIEINPRMALQFCDLFEKVDGINSYEIALAIATGSEPKLQKKRGKFQVAASFVLRQFENCLVLQVPSADELAKVKKRFPDALIVIDYKAGQKLSDYLHDGISYRYALIHLGGKDEEDLFQRYEECKNALPFSFEILDGKCVLGDKECYL